MSTFWRTRRNVELLGYTGSTTHLIRGTNDEESILAGGGVPIFLANAMKRTTLFTLSKHAGAPETWPLTSRLIADGKQTGLSLPGYEIVDQFEISAGYLIVTDYDCPFEEAVNFMLLDRQLRLLARQTVGGNFSFVATGVPHMLKQITWDDDWHFIARFHDDAGDWRFAIRRFHVPFIYPRLTKAPIPSGEPDVK